MAKLTVRLRDYGDEYSSVTARVGDQSGADTWTDLAAVAASFLAAVGGVTLLNPLTTSFFQYTDENADVKASDPYAQRELGLRFFFHDTTAFEKGYLTVPGPDLANIDLESDGDTADLTDSEVAAMVTWIEANVLIQGNAVTVDRAVVVGRAN
jgi:hypothetical protein